MYHDLLLTLCYSEKLSQIISNIYASLRILRTIHKEIRIFTNIYRQI